MAYNVGCIYLGYIYLGLKDQKSQEKILSKVKICLLNIAAENGHLSDCLFNLFKRLQFSD